jgi:uncharacterized membrane-anchored protein
LINLRQNLIFAPGSFEMRRALIGFYGLFIGLWLAQVAVAQSTGISDDERKAAWDAVNAAMVRGPSDVPLGDQATLHLAADMIYIPVKESTEIMRIWGNSSGPGFYGLVFPAAENEEWTVAIDHVAEGFVKDDDAKTWNADELLQSLKDGTEAQNEERLKVGVTALDVIGWVQPPRYDENQHRLVWSLKAVERGAPANQPLTINYNTYALGRDGYFTVNLMTSDKSIERDKARALKIVGSMDYQPGKKYADFKPGTDHVAEYGLAALVAGVAAKKLGLLAVFGVFLAKFAKVIIAAVAVGGGGLFKLFRKKADPAE